jgi:hypothetical protein
MTAIATKLRPIPLDDQISLIQNKIKELEQIDRQTGVDSNIHKINFWGSVLRNLQKLKSKKS